MGPSRRALLLLVVAIPMSHAIGEATQRLWPWPPGPLERMAPFVVALESTLLAAAIVAARLARRPVLDGLGLRRPPMLAMVATSIGLLGLRPMCALVGAALDRLAPELSLGNLETLELGCRHGSAFVLWPLVAVIPAICEELFFRGALQRSFGRGALAIGVSATAFALFHADPRHMLAVLPGAFYLAWAAARTSSTWVAIVAHLVNNGAALLAAGRPSPEAEPWWLVASGLAVATVMVSVVRATSDRREDCQVAADLRPPAPA